MMSESEETESEGQSTKTYVRPEIEALLWRATRLRCPKCGEGKLFRSYFKMHSRCANCHFRIDRDGGYYLGSMYINYGLTAVIMTVTVMSLFLFAKVSPEEIIWPLAAFCLLFPVVIFRHARAFWLALDCQFDRSVLEED